MFKEEYANYLVHIGMLPESMMYHYRPLETADSMQGTVQSKINEEVKPLKKSIEHSRNVVSTKKGGGKKKHVYMQMMMCFGVAVLVLLGLNSIILLVLVVMQMFK